MTTATTEMAMAMVEVTQRERKNERASLWHYPASDMSPISLCISHSDTHTHTYSVHLLLHTASALPHCTGTHKMCRMDINDVDFWMNNDNLKPIKSVRTFESLVVGVRSLVRSSVHVRSGTSDSPASTVSYIRSAKGTENFRCCWWWWCRPLCSVLRGSYNNRRHWMRTLFQSKNHRIFYSSSSSMPSLLCVL